jgi:2-oxoglutarate ferredoxin oxidoreductase subunit beta
VSSPFGSLERPVNPLMYVLAYGAPFVAQGTPADMNGLTDLIEAGLRFSGFAFINIQSPCVTFGRIEDQLKAHRVAARPLKALKHDASDRIAALRLAEEHGETLYTGVFYCADSPPPAYDVLAAARVQALSESRHSRRDILDMFVVGDAAG